MDEGEVVLEEVVVGVVEDAAAAADDELATAVLMAALLPMEVGSTVTEDEATAVFEGGT